MCTAQLLKEAFVGCHEVTMQHIMEGGARRGVRITNGKTRMSKMHTLCGDPQMDWLETTPKARHAQTTSSLGELRHFKLIGNETRALMEGVGCLNMGGQHGGSNGGMIVCSIAIMSEPENQQQHITTFLSPTFTPKFPWSPPH